MGQIKNIKLHIVTDIKMRKQKKNKQKIGGQLQDDLFLLLHDNCWVSEDTLFPNHESSSSSERWIPSPICDGSLQQDYFYRVGGQSVAHIIPGRVSSDKLGSRMSPLENFQYLNTSTVGVSPLGHMMKDVEKEMPLVGNGQSPPVENECKNKKQLVTNLAVHADLKSFACKICHKTFEAKQNLKSLKY